MIEVGWTPARAETALVYTEPESLFSDVYKDIDAAFRFCPAFTSYLKNWYIIRSPLHIKFAYKKVSNTDAKITINDENITSQYVVFDERKHEWSGEYKAEDTPDGKFNGRLKLNKNNNPLISLTFPQLFVTDEKDLRLEQVSPFLHMHELSYFKYLRSICGAFNIYSWVRPLDFAYEIVTDNAVIDIKRGDPLCYVRFVTDKNVSIKQIPLTTQLEDYAKATTTLKSLRPGLPLQKMYDLFLKIRRPKLLS